ncbi:MAG: hypothetical protein QM621_07770 [Aeromicrobium sp.]
MKNFTTSVTAILDTHEHPARVKVGDEQMQRLTNADLTRHDWHDG